MGQLQPGHTDFVIKYLFFYFDIQCSNKLMEFFLVYCYLPFKDCFILKKAMRTVVTYLHHMFI